MPAAPSSSVPPVKDVTIEPNTVYCIDGFTVNITHRQILTPQQTLKVRPKTFSLLLLFLENPHQVLTKELLLTQIWDDVKVEEQVLVQSIRELRQLFSPLEVIQTHPRKGYAWIAPVEKVSPPLETIPAVAATTPSASNRTKRPIVFAAFALVILLGLGVLAIKYFSEPEAPAKNIITVLPVDNRTEGSSLVWARLGMMDQLIQALQFSSGVQVFDVPYVLNLLDVSGVDANDRVQLANRIFEISGSSLVVDLQLSGSVNDYRLLYRLYTPRDQSSGVIIEHQLDKLVEGLARIIATKTDAQLDLSHLHAEFNSSLLAEAVEQWNQQQPESALSLLQTAVTIEPANFLAHQLLIEYELAQQQWPQAVANAQRILGSAEQHYDKEYVFYYLLAKAEFAQGNLEQAQRDLTRAQQLAEQAFDSLYQAYAATLQGDMELTAGNADAAETAYQRALHHHQAIACPIGVSVVRLKLIELYSAQQRNELAVEQWQQLKILIAKHKLPISLPKLDAIQAI